MDAQKNMEERLWNFIDDLAPVAEQTEIKRLLQNDTAWKSKYEELLELQAILKSSELGMPSVRFAKNVMDEIARIHIAPATKSYLNKNIIRSIAFFFIASLAGIIIYGIAQTNFSEGGKSTFTKKVGSLDFSNLFNNNWMNVLIMVNIVVGFVLLDSYLASKKRTDEQMNR